MKKRVHEEDARIWASSIGSDTIDIVDRCAVGVSRRPLRAPLVSVEALRQLQEHLSQLGRDG